jgi:hypothetical protein
VPPRPPASEPALRWAPLRLAVTTSDCGIPDLQVILDWHRGPGLGRAQTRIQRKVLPYFGSTSAASRQPAQSAGTGVAQTSLRYYSMTADMTVTRSNLHKQRQCLRFEKTSSSGVPLRVGGSRRRGRVLQSSSHSDPNAAASPSARAHQRERRPASSKVGRPSHSSSCATHVARLPATLTDSSGSLLAASRRCLRACGAASTARGPHAQAPGPAAIRPSQAAACVLRRLPASADGVGGCAWVG